MEWAGLRFHLFLACLVVARPHGAVKAVRAVIGESRGALMGRKCLGHFSNVTRMCELWVPAISFLLKQALKVRVSLVRCGWCLAMVPFWIISDNEGNSYVYHKYNCTHGKSCGFPGLWLTSGTWASSSLTDSWPQNLGNTIAVTWLS